MLVLTLRTDKSEAEIGLYDSNKCIENYSWLAHRELSATLHKQIEELLNRHKKDWDDIGGIVIFKGPGSFTGLRIGFTVANTLAAGLSVPVVSTMGQAWIQLGLERLATADNEKLALPEYGSEAHITQPRK